MNIKKTDENRAGECNRENCVNGAAAVYSGTLLLFSYLVVWQKQKDFYGGIFCTYKKGN